MTVSCCPVISATLSPTVFNTVSAVWAILEVVVVVVELAAWVDMALFVFCSFSTIAACEVVEHGKLSMLRKIL